MRWTAIGTVVFAAAVSSLAMADGMRGSYGGYQAPPSWSGFYLGINGGYGWGDAETDLGVATSARVRRFTLGGTLLSDDTVAGPSFSASGDAGMGGWLGGVHGGYNWQSRQWVLGVEADFQGTGQDGSVTVCAVAGCGLGTAFGTASHSLDWFGTVRGRLGFLVQPKLMLYGTGGLAYGHVSSDYSVGFNGGPSVVLSEDKTKAGWVIGGGIEGLIGKNWMLRAEYLYVDLGEIGSARATATQSATLVLADSRFVLDAIADANLATKLTEQVFRVGLSYKFGCCDPAPLK